MTNRARRLKTVLRGVHGRTITAASVALAGCAWTYTVSGVRMTIHFDIPSRIEQILRSLAPDPSQAAKAAAMVELYRRAQLSHHELGEALGLSRFQVDELLNRHGVTEDLQTPAALAAELDRLRRALP